jgi:7-keto-8-aminopelargonate synthetase-like enzyme/predicted N-acyltransferase
MKTTNINKSLAVIDDIITTGVQRKILHLTTTDNTLCGNTIHLNEQGIERAVINFGSCSYLGLEFNPELRNASKEAIDNYGTFFSTSRTYLSSRYYQELEGMFEQIFDANTVVTPTTTLGHFSAIPVVVGDEDAILLDHQVHNSVHMAVNLVKTKGVYTELIRHNRMDLLEDKIKALRQRYKRIWYMADGIYSMFGDASPVADVYALMEKYPELHYYVDDAHGMSCFGKHGSGYVLSQKPMHERMVLVTSLAKGFGSGGAVLAFPNKELARKVRTCGGPMITSGPLQPAILGAAIASAKIHLSNQIYEFQESLHENIKFAKLLITKHGLPLISESNSPVFFIGVSLPKIGYSLVQKMLHAGYYVNLGIFPAVPMKNTGVRFTITRLHTFKQIEEMISAFAFYFNKVLLEENVDITDIYRAFKLLPPLQKKVEHILSSMQNRNDLVVMHTNSISQIAPVEWNRLLGDRSNFNWAGLKSMEDIFSSNIFPQDHWDFDYLIIRDLQGSPILATFLTTALYKDDMLASEGVSLQVEKKRKAGDPYYLTSKVVATGCLLSAGNHVYIDYSSPLWKEAMGVFLERVSELQEKYDAQSAMIRDFPVSDSDMDAFLCDNGYFKIAMPDNHTISDLNWTDEKEYLDHLPKKSRQDIKREVLSHEHKYDITFNGQISASDIDHYYHLYLEVYKRSLHLNTFALPYKLFEQIAQDPNWEIMTLRLKPEFDSSPERNPIAVTFSYKTEQNYNAMILGMDYNFLEEHKCYKQNIYQLIKRAKELGKSALQLGYSASHVKRNFGASPIASVAYMQTRDNYSMEVISTVNVMGAENFK